ncbi:MAG: hypothetical protein Kow0059_05370 [Candidatus Sumerlaeia bacterium]
MGSPFVLRFTECLRFRLLFSGRLERASLNISNTGPIMAKLPAKLRKAAQAALVSGESGIPTYRLFDELIENPRPLAAVMEKFDLNERDMRDALTCTAALLRLLEEMMDEGGGAGGRQTATESRKTKKTAAPHDQPAGAQPAALARLARARNIKIYTDGACSGNPGPMGIAFVMLDMEGNVLWQEARAIGKGTNNVAEYSALIAALRKALEFGKKAVYCFSDSELMVRQIRGEYRVKTSSIVPLVREVQALRRQFDTFQIVHVPREQNALADALASAAIRGRR